MICRYIGTGATLCLSIMVTTPFFTPSHIKPSKERIKPDEALKISKPKSLTLERNNLLCEIIGAHQIL